MRPLWRLVTMMLVCVSAGGCSPPARPSASPLPLPSGGSPAPASSDHGPAAPAATVSRSPSAAPGGRSAKPVTAAARYGWTTVVARDDFAGTRLSPSWGAYDSPGNSGEGRRSPGQIKVRHGLLTMTGTADGVTAGMAWDHPRRYGRWEVRARFPAGCECYHPVLILWPDDRPWPEGGEIDYAEVFDARRAELHFFLHYGPDNEQIGGFRAVDMTRWHAYAVEWTPTRITGYVDGKPFFRTTRRSAFPPGRMEPTIQLDWFPDGSAGTGSLQVDWAVIYAL